MLVYISFNFSLTMKAYSYAECYKELENSNEFDWYKNTKGIPLGFILTHTYLPFDWYELTYSINRSIIKKYVHLDFNFNWLTPQMEFEFIRDHPELDWNWNYLTRVSPSHLIKRNIYMYWNWSILVEERNMIYPKWFYYVCSLLETYLSKLGNCNFRL